MKHTLPVLAVALCALFQTGCFRVSSETRALRDAALESGVQGVEETIELGVGSLTFGLVKVASKFLELPPEARMVLDSVKGAECSVFEFESRTGALADVLVTADRRMEKRGWDRVVGVLNDDQLVAVYIPNDLNSPRNVRFSVLVLNNRQLVCASARGNIQDVLQLAMIHAREQIPPHPPFASN